MSNNWIEWKWTPEKPYPETLETKVNILWVTGDGPDKSKKVEYWEWDIQGNDTDISHYKVVK